VPQTCEALRTTEVATVLRERGVFLRSLTEGFDTFTASGRHLYYVLGAVAEFEREVIKERTGRRHESTN
jgi:DNA invertase Pin-like site-specific DNA recombinase